MIVGGESGFFKTFTFCFAPCDPQVKHECDTHKENQNEQKQANIFKHYFKISVNLCQITFFLSYNIIWISIKEINAENMEKPFQQYTNILSMITLNKYFVKFWQSAYIDHNFLQ